MQDKVDSALYGEVPLATSHRLGFAPMTIEGSGVVEVCVILGLLKDDNSKVLGVQGLSPKEARDLAARLIEMAGHAETGTRPVGSTPDV